MGFAQLSAPPAVVSGHRFGEVSLIVIEQCKEIFPSKDLSKISPQTLAIDRYPKPLMSHAGAIDGPIIFAGLYKCRNSQWRYTNSSGSGTIEISPRPFGDTIEPVCEWDKLQVLCPVFMAWSFEILQVRQGANGLAVVFCPNIDRDLSPSHLCLKHLNNKLELHIPENHRK